ncbi:MAG: hypothetical protein D4R67_11250 [Bacteroidetes bacterium]|nr:MAG: hypothetical protein D4R67_11250 [Bacteroidota bacterium]
MKTLLAILIFLIVASGCSPTHRLNRLLALHPELKIPDTILIIDTLTTPQYEADTVIHIDSIHDTVILQKDRLEIKLNRIHDTLYIQGKCKADTVIIQRTIPVEKIKIVRPDKLDNLISALPWFVSGFIVFMALGFFFLRNRK